MDQAGRHRWQKSITKDGWWCDVELPREWDIQGMDASIERDASHDGPFSLEFEIHDGHHSFRYRIGEFHTAVAAAHEFDKWWDQNGDGVLSWFDVCVRGVLWEDSELKTASDQEVRRISRNIMARHHELLSALAQQEEHDV